MRLPYYWRLLWRLWELVKSFCNWGKLCITYFSSVMKSDFREVSLSIFGSHCPFLLLTWSTTADWRKREREISGEIDVDDPIGLLLAAGCCHMLRHLPSTFLYVRTRTISTICTLETEMWTGIIFPRQGADRKGGWEPDKLANHSLPLGELSWF